MKTTDKKINTTIKISQALPGDFDRFAELSEDVKKRSPKEVDWEHSYVGKLDGEIVWFFLFSTDREYPDKLNEEEFDMAPVELIDIYCNGNIRGALSSLQWKFWGCNKRIFNEAVWIWKPFVQEIELMDKMGFTDDYDDEEQEPSVNYWLQSQFLGSPARMWKLYGLPK